MTPAPAALDALRQRRSVSPRRLGGPGPSADDWNAALAAALRAPDHGGLVPWRLIEFPFAQRRALAVLFADEKVADRHEGPEMAGSRWPRTAALWTPNR